MCCYRHSTVGSGNLGLIEKHQNLVDLALVIDTVSHLVGGSVITADNLVATGVAAYLVVRDAEAHHVDAHIRWTLVGVFAIDAFKQSIKNREYLDVAIVVDSCLVVCLQMEWVDHVDVVQVGSSGLVGNVDRMLQWQVPDGEGLELGITRTDATFVLVIQLTQADGHLTRTRSRSSNDD